MGTHAAAPDNFRGLVASGHWFGAVLLVLEAPAPLSVLKLRRIGRITVDFSRVEGFFQLGEHKLCRFIGIYAQLDRSIEAGAVTDMAAGLRARDLDAEPNGVLIVINTNFYDFLDQSAGRTLVPEATTASAPVVRLACPDGSL